MIKSPVWAGLALALAGCSASTVPSTSSAPPPSPLTKLEALTVSDLNSAAAIALAATPPDTEGAQCYTWLAANLGAVQTLSGTHPVVGVVGGFEVARLTVNTAQNGLSPALQTAFETACGPLVLNTIGGITWLLNRLGVAVPKIP